MTTTRQIINSEDSLLHQFIWNSAVQCYASLPSVDSNIPQQDCEVVRYRKADDHYEFELRSEFGNMWTAFNTPGVQWYYLERYFNCRRVEMPRMWQSHDR